MQRIASRTVLLAVALASLMLTTAANAGHRDSCRDQCRCARSHQPRRAVRHHRSHQRPRIVHHASRRSVHQSWGHINRSYYRTSRGYRVSSFDHHRAQRFRSNFRSRRHGGYRGCGR